ncbi:hypothetical protein [Bacillus sp. REN3]|uniref:hypothetical protein n=1 Tax=Bacillus sp. REN3 TaxID=2802440 RepID=UPI001AEF168E|nr:hypothetical protein [Bacillus sp. REN3]
MNKKVVIVALASALIATGGTGLYMVSANERPSNPAEFMEGKGIGTRNMMDSKKEWDYENMQKFMEGQQPGMDEMIRSGDFEDMQRFMEEQNINFGQMKPYMKKMHPDLSDRDLERMYKGMHGTGGAENSRNFRGMGMN